MVTMRNFRTYPPNVTYFLQVIKFYTKTTTVIQDNNVFSVAEPLQFGADVTDF